MIDEIMDDVSVEEESGNEASNVENASKDVDMWF